MFYNSMKDYFAEENLKLLNQPKDSFEIDFLKRISFDKRIAVIASHMNLIVYKEKNLALHNLWKENA